MVEGFGTAFALALLLHQSPAEPPPAWAGPLSLPTVNIIASGLTESELSGAALAWNNAAEATGALVAANAVLDACTAALGEAASAAQSAPLDPGVAAALDAATAAHAEAHSTRDSLRSSLLATVLQGVEESRRNLLLLACDDARSSLPPQFRVAALGDGDLLQLELALAARARAERRAGQEAAEVAQVIAAVLSQPAVAQAAVHLQQAELDLP